MYISLIQRESGISNDMDAVCDGSTGCRNGILYLCTSAAGDDDLYRTDLRHLRMETEPYMDQDEKITDALWEANRQMHSCRIILSHQLGFPTYRNTEAEYFRWERINLTSMIKELEKAREVYFHGVFHRRRRYYVEYDP